MYFDPYTETVVFIRRKASPLRVDSWLRTYRDIVQLPAYTDA